VWGESCGGLVLVMAMYRANCILLESTGEFATVHSFSEEQQPFKDVPIGTVATAWIDPSSGETFVLVLPQTLSFGDRLEHSLLFPNQLCAFGIVVEDTPRQFDKQSTHSISIPGENIVIPLALIGVISYFENYQPSDEELENCRRLVLCSDVPWEPNDPLFACQEQAVAHHSDVSTVLGTVLRTGMMLYLHCCQCLQSFCLTKNLCVDWSRQSMWQGMIPFGTG